MSFTKNMGKPSIVSSLADSVFGRIHGNGFREDYSFVATLRALLLKRTSEDQTLMLSMVTKRLSVTTARERVVRDCLELNGDQNMIQVVFLSGTAEENAACMNTLHSYIAANMNDYAALSQRVEEFVAHVTNAKFYVSEGRRSAIILVDGCDIRRYHYIQCLIPSYVPWFFEDQKLERDELELLRSLTDRYSTKYEQMIEAAAEQYDLRSYLIKQTIGGFEKRTRQAQYDRLQEEINDTQDRITDLLNDYQAYIEMLDNNRMRASGLKLAIETASDESDLVDFFIANHNLIPINADGGVINFIVNAYIDNFDPEMYTTMASNFRSHIYTGYEVGGVFNSKENRKMLLDEIFGDDPSFRIRTCGVYRIDMRGNVNTSAGYRYPQPDCANRIPNPHLQYHACLGNNSRYIIDRVRAGDMIGAISQCISSAKSINIGEGVTVTRFLRDLFQSSDKIIEDFGGNLYTASEALTIIQNKRSGEEHNEAD